MKILMKLVKMIFWADEKGAITPIKFQLTDEHSKERITIKVNVKERSEEKLAGNRMLLFKCQSVICGVEKIYELKYEISTCKWYLYKM